MLTDYEPSEARVLIHEGSQYTDGVCPYDPGGPTRWGITLTDARLHWKKDATAEDVRTMPRSVAQAIYKAKYWDACRCNDLPAGFDDCVFDYGVNSGVARAGKVVRRLVGLPTNDWRFTDEVFAAIRLRKPADLINAMCDERMRFLKSLRIWPTYGNGWTRRVAEVRGIDLKLAANEIVKLPPADTQVQTAGKGHVPPSVEAKGAVAGGGVVAAGVSAGFWQEVLAHPIEAVAIAVLFMAFGALLWTSLTRAHRVQQETPMPGTPVVPVA